MKKQLEKLLLLRIKQFKDSKIEECELIKYHWFNRKFSSRLIKQNNNQCLVITYDITNNCKAFEFKFNINNFNESKKVAKDTVVFIKEDEAEKLCKVLYKITL